MIKRQAIKKAALFLGTVRAAFDRASLRVTQNFDRRGKLSMPTIKPKRRSFVASMLVGACLGIGAATSAYAGPVLDKIKERGVIRVGVGSQPGFFSPDANGTADGATVCQPFGAVGGICPPPFQGTSVDALRPAWAS